MRNADRPAHPLDQRQAHDVAMAEIAGVAHDDPEREAIYLRAMADASRGLTKRELFAAMAMQGMAMRSRELLDHEVAGAAVSLADTLLTKLEEIPSPVVG